MSILLNDDFTFIVQGITGREAVNLTRECLDYGSKIVGGVTPGRKGREVHGVPVFDTVGQAIENHGGPRTSWKRSRSPEKTSTRPGACSASVPMTSSASASG